MNHWVDSPFIVPVAAFAMVIGIVLIKAITGYKLRKLRSQERLAAIEKGVPLPEEPGSEISADEMMGRKRAYSPEEQAARQRSKGIVLTAVGVGAVLFFLVLAHVQQERDVLSGAAASLIPLAIGVGFLIDARIRRKELKKVLTAARPDAPSAP
jgi:hypothetical protein